MTFEINTLFWNNVEPRVIDAHREVLAHFGLSVRYTNEKINHGLWMDWMIRSSKADVVGFMDCDCVPLNREIVVQSANYALANTSFIGVAQVSNHIRPQSHIYAAPAFFFIARACYSHLHTSMVETPRGDVCEEVAYAAETSGVRYRALYPTHFTMEPMKGVWRLGNYGVYGIGTVFANAVYHLYHCRRKRNTDLFVEQCHRIVSGTFVTDGMVDATDLFYVGRIAGSVPDPVVSSARVPE